MGELWLSNDHFRIDAQKVGIEKNEFNSKKGKEVMVKYICCK